MYTSPTHIFSSQDRENAFDDLLFEICEELQISNTRYKLAEQRYKTIGELLSSPGSPFEHEDPQIYPQGSMRLGTTVHPIDGPFDLDFVCQLSISYRPHNPLELLDRLFDFFKGLDRYKDMVEKKNRCVRLVYSDDFYMDILPACFDHATCLTCVQVPDASRKCWKGSNPIGYAAWFEMKSRHRMYKFAAARDMQPLPGVQATEEKEVLQLIVQLLKRWRDIFYARSQYPPISVVLTTLSADLYRGEQSTSEALLSVLDAIVEKLKVAESQGKRISVPNPVHDGEDFSERWNNRDDAYQHFVAGIRNFATRWRQVCESDEDPKIAFKQLFGAVVPAVIEKRAKRTQDARENQQLGIKSSGVITSAAAGVARIRPNTNHGKGSKI